MLTFKNLKNLVDLPAHKEARVPTVKALEESGVSVVAKKILENHGSISVYQNGYVIYRAHKRVTVFSLRNCVHYFIYMLNQASGDRQILAKQLNISPFQLSYVTNSNEGEGLLFYGNTIIPFKDKFDTSLKLYGLMTTKPNEIAKYREKKDA